MTGPEGRPRVAIYLTKEEWIRKYGGQTLLDAEGFDVVECGPECDDSICHGWKVVKRPQTGPEYVESHDENDTTPDIAGAKTKILPTAVVEVFNEMIALHFCAQSQSAHIEQNDIVRVLCERLGCSRSDVFDKGYLDVEPIYEAAGWKVKYDKPGFNETYAAFFAFEPASLAEVAR